MTWIKLYRSVLDWEWYDDSKMVHLFIHLLLKANYEDGKWKGIQIKRGQLLTGIFSLCQQTKISQQSLRTCLEKLKTTNEITIQSTNKYSIITLCNYEIYQTNQQSNNTLANKLSTNEQQTTNKPANHKQEYNNNNKSKEFKEQKNPSAKILFADMKLFFLEEYKKKINTDYYWGAKDAVNLNQLTAKILFKIKQKEKISGEKEKKDYNKEILDGFKHILLSTQDKWINSNFSIPIINSKFNEIFTQILINNGKSNSKHSLEGIAAEMAKRGYK